MSQVTYKCPSLQRLLCGLSVTGVGPVVAAAGGHDRTGTMGLPTASRETLDVQQ